MPYAPDHIYVMGVRISQDEARLLEWARPEVVSHYEGAVDVSDRIKAALLKLKDIERVSGWKAAHPNG